MAYSKYDEEHRNHARAEDARRLEAAHEQSDCRRPQPHPAEKAGRLDREQRTERAARDCRWLRLATQATVEASLKEIIEAKIGRATAPQNEIDQLRMDRAAHPARKDRGSRGSSSFLVGGAG